MTSFEQLVAKAEAFALAKPAEMVARKGDEATLYLYDIVTPPGGGGITARAFVQALESVKDAKTLHLRINSPGGAVFEAKAIYNALREFPGRKVVHVDGLAASAASFIAMAGDHIVTAPEASWFVHGAQTITVGGESAHEDALDLIRMESANIAAIYAKRTKCDAEQIKAWMDAEETMTAEVAKERGFTDSIVGEKEAPRLAAEKPVALYAALARETQRIVSEPDAKARIAAHREQRLASLRSRASASSAPGQPGKK